MFSTRSFLAGLAGLALWLTACDTGPSDPAPPPPDDDIVAGVNLDVLFAAPTPAERNAVEAEWAQRDATLGSRYTFGLAAEGDGQDGSAYRVVLARNATTDAPLFYGLVRIPPHPPGDQRLRPLVLVLPDGSDAVSATLLTNGLPLDASRRDDYVYALLAYRGMGLTADGTEYASPPSSSAYDLDADDALAFLAHARSLGTSALIDPGRVGVLGFGRGGGVALLTASRSNPFDLVVDLGGPTDLFLPAFRARVRAFLEGHEGDRFPAFDELAADLFVPLRDGGLPMAGARRALLRRSPRYFFDVPPYTVVAHGTLDFQVSPTQSRALDALVGTEQAVYLEVEKADQFSLPTDHEVVSLVSTRFAEYLGGP